MATEHAHFLMLLNWMSPTFPIGSFAYSHGMEQAIADGRLQSQADVEHWISDLLQSGSGWNDAVLFQLSWHENNTELNDLALALASSTERFLETTQLGRNFNIAAAVWTGVEAGDNLIAYPIAAGRVCKAMGIAQNLALTAYLQNFCAALVSVAVRLVPLGQTIGLKILHNLAVLIESTVERAMAASIDDIGTCCIAADIATMQHEILETRIFRT
jgi:urease accessory protein